MMSIAEDILRQQIAEKKTELEDLQLALKVLSERHQMRTNTSPQRTQRRRRRPREENARLILELLQNTPGAHFTRKELQDRLDIASSSVSAAIQDLGARVNKNPSGEVWFTA